MTLTIYRLYLKDESMNYVGSTIKNPYERYLEHQTCYNSANFSCGSWRLFDSGQEVLMEALENALKQTEPNMRDTGFANIKRIQ